MAIKKTVARTAAVALLATGGLVVGTSAAMAGDGHGSPGGGLAPMSEHDWTVAPMSDDYGQGLASPATAHYQGKAPWNALDWDGDDKLAPMDENGGSPGGAGVAPAEHDWGIAPMEQGNGSPGGAVGASSGGEGIGLASSPVNGGSPGGSGLAPMYDDNGDGVYDHSVPATDEDGDGVLD
ncbi:hypothetical protein ACFQ0X_42625 [Streptomyces rectiviolaceus]|uniref:Uncharacterized protein n=1 Tax=Streptomyces rectiviolaceus TaxID=332591 RepID=A0ABP6MH61_9ACTN